MKTVIVIDSSFCMGSDKVKEYNIEILPLIINFEDMSIKEEMGSIDILDQVFNKINKTKKIPKTSLPSPNDFLECFSSLVDKGYERILLFTISSSLSGSFQGARVAAEMFMETNDVKIEVYDSKSVAAGAAYSILDIAEKLKQNNDISSQEIEDIINHYHKETKIFLVVDSLDYLSYGGRISPVVASLGNMLGIKPLLHYSSGLIDQYSKVRSNKKAYQTVINMCLDEINSNDDNYYVTSMNIYAEDESNMLLDEITKQAKSNLTVLKPVTLGPVLGIHTGTGTVGVSWAKKR